MSEKGGAGAFAARWSRRKLKARRRDEDRLPPLSPEPVETRDAVRPAVDFAGAADDIGHTQGEGVDNSANLPPVEAIDAATRLAPWLAKTVPEALRLAAMRKAWVADPSIAAFIGPADYAWDWNAPETIPGFGPLRATDCVAELTEQAIGAVRQADMAASTPPAVATPSMTARENVAPAEERSARIDEDIDEPIPNELPLRAARRSGGALPT